MRRQVPLSLAATALLIILPASLTLSHAEDKLDEPPVIVNVEPIIIEGEPIKDKMTPEEIRKIFRDALGDPNKEILKEKWVSGDTMMIETRGSRYCVKFVPPNMRSSIDPVSGFSGLCMGY